MGKREKPPAHLRAPDALARLAGFSLAVQGRCKFLFFISQQLQQDIALRVVPLRFQKPLRCLAALVTALPFSKSGC
jgi:hypothetical protein